jgi:hypothetical protein
MHGERIKINLLNLLVGRDKPCDEDNHIWRTVTQGCLQMYGYGLNVYIPNVTIRNYKVWYAVVEV